MAPLRGAEERSGLSPRVETRGYPDVCPTGIKPVIARGICFDGHNYSDIKKFALICIKP